MFGIIKNILKSKKDGRDGFTRWSNRIIEISKFISNKNRLPTPNKYDKLEYNLYQSYCATKRKFNSGKLSEKQIQFLEKHNIILENNSSKTERWKNKVVEISEFIKEHGFLPKARINDKLYHALARVRRAKEKGKLSEEQLEFLIENNILFKNNSHVISLDIELTKEIKTLIEKNQIFKASQLYLKYSHDIGIKDYQLIENSFENLVNETLNF